MTSSPPATSPADSIVDFETPPVSEVALAVQLAEPVATDAITLGEYWPLFREAYPDIQPLPPLPRIAESFAEGGGQPRVEFQWVEGAVPSRYWLTSADSAELIQVQPDRFAFNWRSQAPDVAAPYPRYSYLRSQFERLYSALEEALERHSRTAVPTWAEVSYINPIPAKAEDGSRTDLSAILRRISSVVPASLPPVEETSFSEKYLLERGGTPYGRFHATVSPVVRLADNFPAYLLTLTARGQVETSDLRGILAFFDEGRALIVNAFRDMTTDAMHEVWGLQ